MAIINDEIKFALLDSLELDQRGDATGRDRASEISEAANAEHEELGCP